MATTSKKPELKIFLLFLIVIVSMILIKVFVIK
jgi:hypothetical protein